LVIINSPRLINFSGLVYLCILFNSCLTEIQKQNDMQLHQLINRLEMREEKEKKSY
jgi:hypothetical protein